MCGAFQKAMVNVQVFFFLSLFWVFFCVCVGVVGFFVVCLFVFKCSGFFYKCDGKF